MKKFIVTTTDSGGGCLKAARIANQILSLSYEVLKFSAPNKDDPLNFFDKHLETASDTVEDWEIDVLNECRVRLAKIGQALDEFDAVELWVDPDANSQLIMLQILHYVASQANSTSKIALVNLTSALGGKCPEHVAEWNLVTTPILDKMVDVAAKCWVALGERTPEPWFELSKKADISYFPFLPFAMGRALQELPSTRNGLSRSQSEILEFVAGDEKSALDVLRQHSLTRELSILDYWGFGRTLDHLFLCPQPAISGLEGHPFSLEMHESDRRRKSYLHSRIRLTDFGKELLEGNVDFVAHNGIDRWWGGTKLFSENIWRWDGYGQRLVGPKST